MASYLARYKKGQYEEVWSELLALGPKIREKALFPEVLEVVTETIERVRHNVELLRDRLEALNYKPSCGSYANMIRPIGLSGLEDLDILEEQTGLLPLSLRIFFEKIGTVDFRGSHPALATDTAQPTVIYSDPLVVYADVDPDPGYYPNPIFGEDLSKANILHREERVLEARYPYITYVSGDLDTKAGYGGRFYTMGFPDPAVDGRLFRTNMYFMQYLRKSIRWGGFPGLATKSGNLSEELKFLTKDLLPF